MSTVKSLIDGFVSVGGVPTLLAVGEEFDADHELVKARPDLFEAVPEPEPVKRPILSRKKDADA